MVHWQSHLDFLRNDFETCMECKSPVGTLKESDLTSISTTLEINCRTCDTAHSKAYNRYMYFLLEYAKKNLTKLKKKKFSQISRRKLSKHISAREKRN